MYRDNGKGRGAGKRMTDITKCKVRRATISWQKETMISLRDDWLICSGCIGINVLAALRSLLRTNRPQTQRHWTSE